MGNLLQLQNGAKSYGTKDLFSDVQFAINDGEHVGVIGPNGAGKTTLFKILAEQESLDNGIIIKAKNLQIGYLQQHDNWREDQTVESYLEEHAKTPIWELKSLGHDLGITDEIYQKPVTSLSGGFRMRVKLLYLIGQEPTLMLLDEPTNYLDLETTLVLEKFLQGYQGAFLLISHDREFLRRTTDHTLEVEQGEITKYNGNIDDYFEQKELLRSQLEARAMSLQEKKDEILKFVARFGAKATKASQAQSRLKSLDKMETIELRSLPIKASIKIPQPIKTGRICLTVENAVLGYGERIILKKINYILQSGEDISIVGLNGAGKTTFLKALAGALEPLQGKVMPGLNVTIGYYAQHVAEGLDPNGKVIDQIMALAHPDITQQNALDMAGSLLFSGTDINKKISVLSGGEKARVALGRILLQRAPCLILDEPTNHLDFQTVEALTQALGKYEGTVVVVSHDRSFIRRVGRKIIEVNHGEVTVFPGSYDDYVWSLQNGILSERKSGGVRQSEDLQASPSQLTTVQEKGNYKETKKNIDRDLKKWDKIINEANRNLGDLNGRLAVLNQIISGNQSAEINQSDAIKDLVEVQIKIDSIEAQWFEATEKKEELERALQKLTEKN